MSELRRFFTEKCEGIGSEIILTDEEFRHAVNVLRIRVGEKVIVCDNSGYEFTCLVKDIAKKQLTLLCEEKNINQTEPKTEVVLICGYLKGDKSELVVQKAVELGISKIVVFDSQFSSSYISENKLARLNKVSVEASKQCGRAIAPKVYYAKDFSTALSFGENYENKLFACEFAQKNQVDYEKLSGSTAIVVGSEGGFSKEEYNLATSLGYETLYLGKRILRAETASIVLCGIIMHRLGEFE